MLRCYTGGKMRGGGGGRWEEWIALRRVYGALCCFVQCVLLVRLSVSASPCLLCSLVLSGDVAVLCRAPVRARASACLVEIDCHSSSVCSCLPSLSAVVNMCCSKLLTFHNGFMFFVSSYLFQALYQISSYTSFTCEIKQ